MAKYYINVWKLNLMIMVTKVSQPLYCDANSGDDGWSDSEEPADVSNVLHEASPDPPVTVREAFRATSSDAWGGFGTSAEAKPECDTTPDVSTRATSSRASTSNIQQRFSEGRSTHDRGAGPGDRVNNASKRPSSTVPCSSASVGRKRNLTTVISTRNKSPRSPPRPIFNAEVLKGTTTINGLVDDDSTYELARLRVHAISLAAENDGLRAHVAELSKKIAKGEATYEVDTHALDRRRQEAVEMAANRYV